ncbi:MAG: hypothetical protein JXA66_03485 [Oligoflexia bacterium]|nr:hypothetical protein [Oligoflexia bacterium]
MAKFAGWTNFNVDFTELTPQNVVKIHRIVTTLTVVMIAFFAARLVATGITALLGSISVPVRTTPATRASAREKAGTTEISDYDIIITRNLFNSKNEIPDDELLDSEKFGSEHAQKTRLDIELLGTIVVSDPLRSVAAIRIKKDKDAEAFVVNDTILSKVVIVSIARKKVILKNITTGELEYVEMQEDEDTQSVSTTISTGAGIRQISEDHVLVEKGEVDRALENINELLTQARAVPHLENGQVAGFRIFGIKPGSLYDKLGAKNGDIIRSVNGVEIRDPASAMSLYQKLRSTDKFEINFERGGENRTSTIDIR